MRLHQIWEADTKAAAIIFGKLLNCFDAKMPAGSSLSLYFPIPLPALLASGPPAADSSPRPTPRWFALGQRQNRHPSFQQPLLPLATGWAELLDPATPGS